MPRQISYEMKAEALDLLAAGFNIPAVVSKTGYSETSVRRWIESSETIRLRAFAVPAQSIGLVKQALINSPVSVWALGSRA